MPHTNNKEVEKRFRNNILDVETAVRLTYNGKDSDQIIKEMLDFLHQELQKVREEWLRKEIVKLEGMKENDSSLDSSATFNYTLQTIIDRYQSELDQPN